MKKIILLIIGMVLLGILGWAAYSFITTRKHSPADKVEFQKDDFQLTVNYCRPYKRGRLIFGRDDDGALVPYGKYWRTGANEATEIEFNKDILFNGQKVTAGRYRFYTIPGPGEWIVALNSELGKWGYYEADDTHDVLRTHVTAHEAEKFTEQFTIEISEITAGSLTLVLKWDQTEVKVPISF